MAHWRVHDLFRLWMRVLWVCWLVAKQPLTDPVRAYVVQGSQYGDGYPNIWSEHNICIVKEEQKLKQRWFHFGRLAIDQI